MLEWNNMNDVMRFCLYIMVSTDSHTRGISLKMEFRSRAMLWLFIIAIECFRLRRFDDAFFGLGMNCLVRKHDAGQGCHNIGIQ